MIQSKPLLVVLLMGVLFSTGRAGPETASVTVLAVTPFGEVLSPVKVTRFAARGVSGRDYSTLFVGARARGIPSGVYFAQVIAGRVPIAADVRVWSPDALVVVSGTGVFIEKGPAKRGTAGRVTGLNGAKPAWVRMVRVYSEDLCCTVVPVSDDGAFSFGGAVNEGAYLLLVLTDGRVLFEGRIRIDDSSSFIDVDLARARATVRRP